jgi:hypothetical protein
MSAAGQNAKRRTRLARITKPAKVMPNAPASFESWFKKLVDEARAEAGLTEPPPLPDWKLFR